MKFTIEQLKEMAKKTGSEYKGYTKPKGKAPATPVDDNLINISSSCVQVPASTVVNLGYEFSDSEIIPSSDITGSFFQSGSIVEFFSYSIQKQLITQDYNFTDYTIEENTDIPDSSQATTFTDNATGLTEVNTGSAIIPSNNITLTPATDLFDRGLDNGELYAVYNFINYELASSTEQTYYIAEISGDRTEIRLKSNAIASKDIKDSFITLRDKLNSTEYFDEFYLGFYKNNYVVAINVLLEEDPQEVLDPSILIKLYEPLPANYNVEQRLYVATKVGETVAYQVEFVQDFTSFVNNANYIKGPNVNIPLQELVNNSTTLKSYDDLTKTQSSSSLDSVLNYLNKTGVTITPNYSYNTFNEFVNFSSAKQRVYNFYEKVSQIQSYQSDIDTLTTTTGSNPGVVPISQSLASLQTNITNLVKNFDGFESYLYYNSSSFAYPKTGSTYPYALLPTSSLEVDTWMGSDVENNQYYGGIILSASLYDEDNQNWLYYTIPTFITENSENDEYVEFSNMVGQSFDEVWLYTKALSERYNTTNDPESGLPLDLAAEAIKGLGFETFGNNYDNQDNFIGLTGEDNGIFVPPTGSELITDYIAINSGKIINYWNLGYSWLNYVEQINEPGFPYAIDKVSKEIYKRLYHNMAYLTKKKGTISGLRQLINIWGIPNTILRINEFGGKNRDNTDDYDLWYERYSYAYTPVANQYAASSSVKMPWMPLQRNYIDSNEYIVPDGIALRFKTTGHPSSSFGGSYYSQSIAVKKSNGTNDKQMDWGISLFYEDQPSGSYSGSSFSDYYNYGKLRFYMSASAADGGIQISDDISLPFFDGGWWSVLLQRDQHVSASDNSISTTYTLFAANKQVDGWDGNSLGWSGSVSMSSANTSFNSGYGGGNYDEVTYDILAANKPTINSSWNNFGVTEHDGVYVGGYVSGSDVMTEVLNEGAKIFSGSFQEFRYYSNNISKEVFNDFVMNPESVEGNNVTGSESSFDIVNFRAPLGNELEYKFTSSVSESFSTLISSSHPAITGSAPMVFTQSFIDPTTSALTSSYDFIGYEAASTYTYSKPNVETYFLDQPAIGVRNRISNKIQVSDGEDYGTVLSKYRSIDQDYLISQSYTEDITSLEVGFSPQDEVNDDIIATYGYGVISDVLADPRFAYDGKENYYPKLRQIANEYFKKYTEGDVWDYLRLIKYFDNSLFKAIKSFVPARTSVTTGVIVKQHMLERNRRVPITVNPNTIIAYTPETGSVVGGQSTAEGMNSPISYRDLELTGSIDIVDIEGSTGGVLNPYNVEVTQSGWFSYYGQTSPSNIPDQYINLFTAGGVINSYGNIVNSDFGSGTGIKGFRFKEPIKTRFNVFNSNDSIYFSPDTGFELAVSSSIRGIIGTDIFTSASLTNSTFNSSSYYEMLPGEDIAFWVRGLDVSVDPPTPAPVTIAYLAISPWNIGQDNYNDFQNVGATPIPYSSSIWNSFNTQSYIVKNETISGSVYEIHKSQDEFYNGEFSGSEITVTTQSLLVNPYAPPIPIDTTYKLFITASDGTYENSVWNTTDSTQTTFPSGAIELIVTSSFHYNALEGFGIEELYSQFQGWETQNLNSEKTGSLFIQQYPNGGDEWWVVGLILPNKMAPPQTSPTSLTFNSCIGWSQQNTLEVGAPVADYNSSTGRWTSFLQPVSNINPVNQQNPLDSGFPAFVSQPPSGQLNQWGPYIKMPDISGSLNNYWVQASGLDYDPTDANYNNLSYESLFSTFLGNNESVRKYFSTTNLDTAVNPLAPSVITKNNKYGITKYWFDKPWDNGARPLRLDQPFTGISQPSIFKGNVKDCKVFMSPEAKQRGALGSLQKAGDLDSYGVSSGSLSLIGTTWTGSYYDGGSWFPELLVLNNKVQNNLTGDIFDNFNTLTSPPEFEFDVILYSGVPVTEDRWGYSGSRFVQNLNDLEGIIAYSDVNGENLTGYQYNSANSRYLSGSIYSTGLPPVQPYQPNGLQLAQYINFDPQLPDNFVEFENSAFYPLINNATESVKNTYVQVVEYDNGPIPSNIEAVISKSALKARIPDSFYTQKANITNKYLGSTLQSADYNDYSKPDKEITWLNGHLSGSIFSGSAQTSGITQFCFPAGTNISTTKDSVKNIEDFKSGDSILTYDTYDNKHEEGILGKINKTSVSSLIEITFNDGNIIQTTEEHPFYVKDKGLIDASELKPLDVCKTINEGLSTISTIDKIKGHYKVYNLLDVDPNSNYYANGILVHNKSAVTTLYTTPSWPGDSKPLQMPSMELAFSTIFKAPIYFAHYRSSKGNYELWDTTTFNIDQLIEVPFENVNFSAKSPISPTVIKIDGADDQVSEVRSTFEVDRKAEIAYNQGKLRGLESSSFNPVSGVYGRKTLNYTSLPIGNNKIFQGALEYQALLSNERSPVSYASYMAFNTSSLFGMYKSTASTGYGKATASVFVDQVKQVAPGTGWVNQGYKGYEFFLSASEDTDPSSPYYQKGYLRLQGGGMMITSSAEALPTAGGTWQWIAGPGLGAIHSINKRLQMGADATNIQTGQDVQIGWPIGSKKIKTNGIYFGWDVGVSSNSTSSFNSQVFPEMGGYQDFSLPFIIEPGDEVRIAYSASGNSPSDKTEFETADFTVTAVPSASSNIHDYSSPRFAITANINSASIYDRLYVTPNPMDLGITDGHIFHFTIRRRVNASDRVIVYQTNPTGSLGVKTLGPSGYLIPGDLTPVQKRNVATIINQLRAKNAFRADEDNDTRRFPIE